MGESEATGGAPSTRYDTVKAEDQQQQALSGEEDADAIYEDVDDMADSQPKKKRRTVKADKKYQCPQDSCDKAYSRAEHLYRHQLNHSPKQIYRCDFLGCERHFVRADLCARHKERHTAKGSHLQRKDAFFSSQKPSAHESGATSPSGSATMNTSPVESNHLTYAPPSENTYLSNSAPSQNYSTPAPPPPYPPQGVDGLSTVKAETGLPVDPQLSGIPPYSPYQGHMNGLSQPMGPPLSPSTARRFSYDNAYARPISQTNVFNPPTQQILPINTMQPSSPSPSSSAGTMYGQSLYPSPSLPSQPFRAPMAYHQLPSLPPFGPSHGYAPPSITRSGSLFSSSTMSSNDQFPLPNSRENSIPDFNVIDQMNSGYAMPVFGNDGFNRSPPVIVDDHFLASLFVFGEFDMPVDPSPPAPPPEPMQIQQGFNVFLPKLEPDGTLNGEPLPSATSTFPKPSSKNVLDINIRESDITEKKRHRLIDQVRRWNDIDHNPGRKTKAEFLVGNENDPNHVLSLHMLKTYITSYWIHIFHQMPILHRPTFNPETCPDLLLLAMMCLGATCLERTHPLEVTQNSSELAFFVAHHLRWCVFQDAEFRPPAKLWTFQSLLLLELFEKMYSTRELHTRSHIHHATTLVVMRRGSSLIGRSATDSPHDGSDPTRTPPGPDGSINVSGQNTPDAFWNRWITAEATRRVAFAAFVIDSTHATLFGHSAVMSPHDLKLPLPCDEALWAATSSAEVQRVEASLAGNGIKPVSFIDGLKQTLNGRGVRTNTFGRVVLMAGLLNVSWHMNQRDLQVSSLGAARTLGSQIKWRSPLTRAFDFWRRDFDDSLSKNEHWLQLCNLKSSDRSSIDDRDNVFEARTCLHSLAHMAMHVDIIDCLVFAGSDRVLSRLITEGDRAVVRKRMREQWAPSARARDAVFYALRFLCEVLIPDEDPQNPAKRQVPGQPLTFNYSARDDFLLNRPWILYVGTLIVWSYGYALDGPISPSNYTLSTRELQILDMQRYLKRVGGVTSPDDLEALRDRNNCLGLLLLLQECFRQPRWELLHEAHEVLGSCIDLLVPRKSGLGGKHATGV